MRGWINVSSVIKRLHGTTLRERAGTSTISNDMLQFTFRASAAVGDKSVTVSASVSISHVHKNLALQ